MFTIKLYKFNKKPNSTAVPAVAGTSYSCTMKTVSSLLSPVIDIADTKQTGAIPLYNYAYIADFDRYYFIDDVSWSQGIWSLSMHVDVLGSFRNDILNSTQYVIRSASRSNPYIPDTAYQTYIDETSGSFLKQTLTNQVQRYNATTDTWIGLDYFNRSISEGAVCIGVLSGTVTGVTYYIMRPSSFQYILNKLFNLVPSDMTDVSSGLGNAIYNPMQYITYCRWFPVMPMAGNLGGSTTSMSVGGYSISYSRDLFIYQMTGLGVEKYRFNIDLPIHPNAANYPYLRLSPFSEYSLNFQPFGNIPLDTTKMIDASRLTAQWSVDFCTGQCILEILSNASHKGLIYTETTDYGVPMPISSLVMDWKAGLAMSAMTWLKNKDIVGATDEPVLRQLIAEGSVTQADLDAAGVTLGNTNLFDAAMNVIGASMGNVVSKGSAGSFLSYNAGAPYVYLWYTRQAEHDPDRYGAPLYKRVRLNELDGFCLCSNATVTYRALHPMNDEQLSVIRYLNSGIYLE